ncbi:DUF4974 domain-containing protein [Chitinophaga lutea]|uniref:DUF4974 domain-containing protein n=1 Tax=Chitinophaga lutea TaxID=2488634 RepID=A0A3N4QJV0_9BACT|nr:FecR domain-containing protein [Chitinophaga lutea]RPE12044.1 DUF4974 domain-containing protein [Chitinophaga lutea]
MDKEYIQELLLKEHYGLLSPEEQEELNALLATSEEVREMREELQRDVPKGEAMEAMEAFDVNRNLAYIEHEVAVQRSRRRRQVWSSAAAVVLVLLGVAWLLLKPGGSEEAVLAANGDGPANGVTLKLADGKKIALSDSGRQTINLDAATLTANNRVLEYSGEGEAAGGWNTLTVPPKLDFQVKLADGTIVWLNSLSEIKFPFHFTDAKREVYIKGEAYFKVAQDAGKPFVVHTSSTSITVLGTEFNVNAYNQGIITTSLVSGKVAVSADERRVELRPGTEAVVHGMEEIRVQPLNADMIAWRSGTYYFADRPMREIAAMVERWHDVKVVMDNAAAGEQRFRVKLFRGRPLQTFIDNVNETGEVQLYWNNGVLHCK